MDINLFDYYLPEELIAQTPLKKRDSSKLLVLDKETGSIEHKHFTSIIDYMEKASFAKLLKAYSSIVVEFILAGVSSRLEMELREEIADDELYRKWFVNMDISWKNAYSIKNRLSKFDY